MTRLKSIPFAIAGLVVLAGTAAAFAALPEASTHGIQTATDASGKSVPVRAVPADPTDVAIAAAATMITVAASAMNPLLLTIPPFATEPGRPKTDRYPACPQRNRSC